VLLNFYNNWEILKNYFILAITEDKLQSPVILTCLNDNSIKTHMLFLKYSFF